MKNNLLMVAVLIVLAVFMAVPVVAQTGAGDPAQEDTGMQAGGGAEGQMAQGPLKASQLMGATVQSQEGTDLGEVSDLVFSDSGSVEYLVLSRGGVIGIGARMVPVPWQQVQQINTQNGNNALIVSLDEQKLQNAPSFSKNEWDQLSQSDFEQQVRGYYGEEGEQGSMPGMEEEQPDMGGEQGMTPGGEETAPGGMPPGQPGGMDSQESPGGRM